jgi:glucose/arabinose dehydrogenase
MRRVLICLSLLGFLATAAPAQALSAPQLVTGSKVVPWGLAFLPDGSALFTERVSRSIWAVAPGKPARKIYTVGEAVANGEGGLLGIAVGPTYGSDLGVYLYYSTGSDNRIAFIRRGSAARPTPLVTGIPTGSNHNGGRLVFGTDGLLYAGTGDAGNSANAQNASSLGGKVLRLTREGRVPAGQSSLVYSMGHRNVQGLVFDRTGNLWATEFGQNTYDEVNVIVQGGNYGWPTVEGKAGDSRFRDPVWQWSPSEASPSGIGIKGDSLYVAALRGQRIWRLRFSGTSIASATSMLSGSYGRLRTVMQNPRDGAMWVMTSNRDGRGTARSNDDKVLRFTQFP